MRTSGCRTTVTGKQTSCSAIKNSRPGWSDQFDWVELKVGRRCCHQFPYAAHQTGVGATRKIRQGPVSSYQPQNRRELRREWRQRQAYRLTKGRRRGQ
ncbi:unnamed protein product [Chondrus crispus]|uniref:Uncharacterized protein n=1 Tax=Chondrus crispus TaxID=2769 RepID=R7QMN7_CHOCR|nr:unnamed protein product [Chondrus crispus]CDF38650.1 unnamed protein product [Chondrus crispus]|eukprot:XP_005718555.1 unnamed protein product [Chondrus crispus]